MPEVAQRSEQPQGLRLKQIAITRACQAVIHRKWWGRAIERCGAPGLWQQRRTVGELARMPDAERARYAENFLRYPQVFLARNERIDPSNPNSPFKAGTPVGETCPCCGHDRPRPEIRRPY